MGYRDKKNSWHVVFETFNKTFPNLSKEVEFLRPAIIYPIIEVQLNDGRKFLFHGRTLKLKQETTDDLETEVWNMLE